MTTKLTLSLDDQTIKKAKDFAKQTGKSLSSIVENYLRELTSEPESGNELPEDLVEIFGVISLPEGYNEKMEIRKIMTKKL
ncbi:MAG: hypothetical protein KDC53_14690 [Saprospiraceae bacterium]|nr:hypothetical protein [Saprospiraceae bacterium]